MFVCTHVCCIQGRKMWQNSVPGRSQPASDRNKRCFHWNQHPASRRRANPVSRNSCLSGRWHAWSWAGSGWYKVWRRHGEWSVYRLIVKRHFKEVVFRPYCPTFSQHCTHQTIVHTTAHSNNILHNDRPLYTLRPVQRGLLFKVAMAAGIRLFPKRALLHLSALYLCLENSRVR